MREIAVVVSNDNIIRGGDYIEKQLFNYTW